MNVLPESISVVTSRSTDPSTIHPEIAFEVTLPNASEHDAGLNEFRKMLDMGTKFPGGNNLREDISDLKPFAETKAKASIGVLGLHSVTHLVETKPPTIRSALAKPDTIKIHSVVENGSGIEVSELPKANHETGVAELALKNDQADLRAPVSIDAEAPDRNEFSQPRPDHELRSVETAPTRPVTPNEPVEQPVFQNTGPEFVRAPISTDGEDEWDRMAHIPDATTHDDAPVQPKEEIHATKGGFTPDVSAQSEYAAQPPDKIEAVNPLLPNVRSDGPSIEPHTTNQEQEVIENRISATSAQPRLSGEPVDQPPARAVSNTPEREVLPLMPQGESRAAEEKIVARSNVTPDSNSIRSSTTISDLSHEAKNAAIPQVTSPQGTILDAPPAELRIQPSTSTSAPVVAGAPYQATSPNPPQAVTQQIVAALESGKGNDIEIRLDPEELGKVRIVLSTRESAMTVMVFAERAETLELMRRNSGDLSAGLSLAGFGDADLQFGQGTPQQQDEDPSQGSDTIDLPDGTQHQISATRHLVASDKLDLRF